MATLRPSAPAERALHRQLDRSAEREAERLSERHGGARDRSRGFWSRPLDYLPRGNLLDDTAWRNRHVIVQWLLLLHVPGLVLFGLWQDEPLLNSLYIVVIPTVCLLLGWAVPRRRLASFFTTAGLVYCSSALVGLSHGMIEAHFHFFIIIGFIALYQDWIPFLWNIIFTVLSHGIGSTFQTGLMFNHVGGQTHPWEWSLVHGVAVLAACVGVVLFWRTTEDEQQQSLTLTRQLSDAELARRRFTSELLVNLARRNQSMLYRQLEIINQLEEKERDPDALSELFRLDHLATRIRRNAESLLVLSGEEPPRVWSKPVGLLDIVRAAIAETEDLNRVTFVVDERLAVLGHAVTDLTHLLAELTENAVRFSPPDTRVTIRSSPDPREPGTCVLTVEDWGVGMRKEDLISANEILSQPQDVDAAASQRLGLHVVSRLSHRHHITVTLAATAGAGLTAVILLPAELFAQGSRHVVDLTTTSQSPGAAGRRGQGSGPTDQMSQPGMPQQQLPVAATGGYAMAPQGRPSRDPVYSVPVPVSASNGSSNGSILTPQSRNGGSPWLGWWGDDEDRPGDDGPGPEPMTHAPVTHAPVTHAPVAYGPLTGPLAPWDTEHNRSGAVVVNEKEHGPTRRSTPDDDVAPVQPETEQPGLLRSSGRLNRRTPQSHLAPELRRAEEARRPAPLPAPMAPMPDPVRAMDALSRYQANRQAALAKESGRKNGKVPSTRSDKATRPVGDEEGRS